MAEKTHSQDHSEDDSLTLGQRARRDGVIGALPTPPEVDTLEIPKDIAKMLDRYAAALGGEYLFPVSRQQAWERLARTFLPKEGAAS